MLLLMSLSREYIPRTREILTYDLTVFTITLLRRTTILDVLLQLHKGPFHLVDYGLVCLGERL